MTTRARGSDVDSELQNAERLLSHPGELWGWGSPAGRERVARRVRFLTESVDARPGRRLLELGCGTGIFTAPMAQSGASITGVDIAAVLIDEARRATARDSNVDFVVGDLMERATLADRRFDAVYGVSVLHHLDLDRALPAIAAVLERGARFAFSEPNLQNPINRFWIFTDNMERRARMAVSATEMAFLDHELVGALQRHNFVVDDIAFRDFLHPSTPPPLIGLIDRLGRVLERAPLVRRGSGSLWVRGRFQPR